MLVKCNCVGKPDTASSYQDNRYGFGMRVANPDVKGSSASCTVCGKEHKVPTATIKENAIQAKEAKKAKVATGLK